MAGIMTMLREASGKLHPQERRAAQYILEHGMEAAGLGITELAQRAGVSTATVSRLCKTFHFSTFTDFKMKLSAELALQPSAQSYQDIVAGNPLEDIVSAMAANHIRSITDTTRLLDLKKLQQAVDVLAAANRIDIYGSATSGIVAEDFYQKLVRIGIHAASYSDSHLQITSASLLRPGDVALAISYSGETPETIDALRCAKENGATAISLTKFGANTLANLADIQLFTSTLEEGMRRGNMASRIAQLHVIDILFTGLVSSRFDEYVPRLENSYQMVRKYRVNKGVAEG
ncbi:MurR/RpiR family transcriptional regulator [Gorillibacterium massiliense]|uniref:MurR/RpiR family transcriptional regulator n=1 Tax=Gorillibacterium massiliense TaxID=1280390 RepID=UPI0004ACAD50|nr:MurR/RpiR family transcriptional regulator [Gorillibacterium massiliense]